MRRLLRTFWQNCNASDPSLPAARVAIGASKTDPADVSTAAPLRDNSAATNTSE
jgi:hypothetical protein